MTLRALAKFLFGNSPDLIVVQVGFLVWLRAARLCVDLVEYHLDSRKVTLRRRPLCVNGINPNLHVQSGAYWPPSNLR